ncbi:signal recognition particle receptor alpha subunit family protein [Striga asiatica]|uniref:Signal recognition particle receptor alpha subunit family protein n=1 Tax=Striga asiatica TaxID=4170 RepID=A0A5A7QF88_STRAF|nr:signal recognition particle receptor alpha subunit family protein [Striga asiatica]
MVVVRSRRRTACSDNGERTTALDVPLYDNKAAALREKGWVCSMHGPDERLKFAEKKTTAGCEAVERGLCYHSFGRLKRITEAANARTEDAASGVALLVCLWHCRRSQTEVMLAERSHAAAIRKLTATAATYSQMEEDEEQDLLLAKKSRASEEKDEDD